MLYLVGFLFMNSCKILVKLEFSRLVFENYSNIKFRANPSSMRPAVPYGRMDRRTTRDDEANGRFSQFSELF